MDEKKGIPPVILDGFRTKSYRQRSDGTVLLKFDAEKVAITSGVINAGFST
jgi:hypothetical protein